MPHRFRQVLRLRFQRCIQLREAFPLSDHVHGVDRVAAQDAGHARLQPRRNGLALQRDFPQAVAMRRLFLDQRGERFPPMTQGSSEGIAASLALEKKVFRGGNPGL